MVAADQTPYTERSISDAKLLKMNEEANDMSNQASNLELSKSIKGHSININESSLDLRAQTET